MRSWWPDVQAWVQNLNPGASRWSWLPASSQLPSQKTALRTSQGCGVVFPGSRELGTALGVPWMVTLDRDEAWFALAAWVVVLLAMISAFAPAPSRLTARSPRG